MAVSLLFGFLLRAAARYIRGLPQVQARPVNAVRLM